MDVKIEHMMEELSSTMGGSLVKRIQKMTLSKNNAIFFIGLGGMGCKTVNQIKKIYQTEYEQSNHVRFLAIDTALDDLDKLTVGYKDGQGYLVGAEKFEIFSDEAIKLLITPPATVDSWKNKNLQATTLDKTGAKQTRQIGRIMLCGTNKYSTLKARIDSEMDSIFEMGLNGEPCIVLIAGLSGGTGSGTFLDVSYMIQMLCNDYLNSGKVVHFFGTFYTADVQKNIKDIKSNPAIWNLLQRNCYAALKELDYFMNNGSMEVGGEDIYQLALPNGETVSTSCPVFKSGNVFLVSATSSISETNDIIERTARSLLNMHQQIPTAAGVTPQSFLSSYSNNEVAQIPGWGTLHTGQAIIGKPTDNCGIEYVDFPVFMNYCYSSFGMNTVYFPRDEIMAYCANIVMNKMIDVWQKNGEITQEFVYKTVAAYRIDSLASICAQIKNHIGYSDFNLTIPTEQYPIQKTFLGVGKAEGMDTTMNYATRMAENLINPFASEQNERGIAHNIFLPFLKDLENPEIIRKNGPFALIALLGGVIGRNIAGCLDILGNFASGGAALNDEIARQRTLLENAVATMKKAADVLKDDITPSDDDVRRFVVTCEEYARVYAEYLIYDKLFGNVVSYLIAEMNSFNNETYNIFVPIIKELSEMLNENSTIVASTSETVSYKNKTFSMDAMGIANSKAMRQKFRDIFGGYITNAHVDKVAQDFVNSMFGNPEGRKKWKNYFTEGSENTSSLLNEEIRHIFNDFFGPFVEDTLEKFLVLAYSPDNLNLTADKLDEIWNADPGIDPTNAAIRDNAIFAAANSIVNCLRGNGGATSLLRYTDDLAASSMNIKQYVILLNYTPRLNAHIKNIIPNASFCEIGSDYRSCISAVTYCSPAALPLVNSMTEYAKKYYESSAAGKHLEENLHNWETELTEIIGVDAERYWTCPETKNRTDLSVGEYVDRDRKIYDEIRQLVEYGLEKGFIYDKAHNDPTANYILLAIDSTTDKFTSLYKNYRSDISKSFAETVKATMINDFSIECHEVSIKCNNPNLQALIREVPTDPNKLKNLYRVVRADMRLLEALRKAVKYYSDSGIFDELASIKESEERKQVIDIQNRTTGTHYDRMIQLFADMLLCDLVRYDEVNKIWEFRYTKDGEWKQLFNFKAPKKDFENTAKLYLAFSGGLCTNVSDEYINVIRQTINQMFDNGEYIKRDDIISEAAAVLNHAIMINPVATERNKQLEELHQNSRYKNFYNMPAVAENGSVIYENLVRFYNDIKDKVSTAD